VLTHLAFYAGWPNAMSAVPIAITNVLNGNNVDWMEQVSDKQYGAVSVAP
jgi:hypothetical protein